jgi:hypothetical protein
MRHSGRLDHEDAMPIECRSRITSGAIGLFASAAVLGAATAVVMPRLLSPRPAEAQEVIQPGSRYAVVVIPGEDVSWLVLDTRSGELQHWMDDGGRYRVFRLRESSSAVTRTIIPKPER